MRVSADDYGNNDPEFLRYYAAVLTREADARPGSNCQWMRDGAERALRRADELSTPFKATSSPMQIGGRDG